MQHKSSESHQESHFHPKKGWPDYHLLGRLIAIIVGIFLTHFGYYVRSFTYGLIFALFLPLVTLPQIIIIGVLMNKVSL